MPFELMRDRYVYKVVHSDAEDAVDLLMSLWEDRFGGDDTTVLLADDAREQAEHMVATVRDDHAYFVVAPSGRIEIESSVNIAGGWEDFGTDIIRDMQERRAHQIEKGYTPEHDDEHGLQHVLDIAASYQSGFGETPTDEGIRGDLIDAMATLHAAVELLDRGIKARQDEGHA